MRDKRKEARLNQAVCRWKQGDADRKDALRGEIFLLAFEL